jgi:hypothetical protein
MKPEPIQQRKQRTTLTLLLLLAGFLGQGCAVGVPYHAHRPVVVHAYHGSADNDKSIRNAARYQVVQVEGRRYYYRNGVFYRKGPGGFTVIAAPVGAVVTVLPRGIRSFRRSGVTYYRYADVYYQAISGGYRVVPPPSGRRAHQRARQQIEVQSASLNVRSGPGRHHSIVRQVRQGQRLPLLDTRKGWYFILLPDGSRGWVMARHTSLLPAGGTRG